MNISQPKLRSTKCDDDDNNNNNNLYKAMEISQSLSINRITKQYKISVYFYLILNKQYAYVGA